MKMTSWHTDAVTRRKVADFYARKSRTKSEWQFMKRWPGEDVENALVRYDAACRAIEAAATIDEARDFRDKSEAMRAYARQAKKPEAGSAGYGNTHSRRAPHRADNAGAERRGADGQAARHKSASGRERTRSSPQTCPDIRACKC